MPQKIFKANRYQADGFTLVETLVAIAVLGLFFLAVALILQRVLTFVGESRVRTVALSLAQSKMELIRNLSYADVGTVGGIPNGAILPDEIIEINGLPFNIKTSIVYIDDPFDTTAPNDMINTDYKRARVEITWEGTYPSRIPVTFVTNIAPKGIETITGGGTIRVQIFNASGIPVSNATLNIQNTVVNPPINMQVLSGSDGLVTIPGAPPCNSCYKLNISKTGYSTAKTYGTDEITNPLQPHMTVIEGEISQESFAIDQVSILTVRSYGSRELGYPPIANVQFQMRGTKVIGYNTEDEPVYKTLKNINTGGGIIEISNLEWDTYEFDFSNSYHNLAGSNPLEPLAVPPNSGLNISIVAVPKTNASLLIAVKNADGELQSSASAYLFNSMTSFEASKSSGATGSADFGQMYFGNLNPGVFDLKINLSGYIEATSSINITGNQKEVFLLNFAQ